jgi:m7GpppX diphosphatase
VNWNKSEETPDMLKSRYENQQLESPAYDETFTKELGFIPAILLVAKSPALKQDAEHVINNFSTIELLKDNDIYKTFTASGKPDTSFSRCKLDLIYPASQKHFEKYSAHLSVLIEETADEYTRVTQLYVLRQPPERLNWIWNLFSHKDVDPGTLKEHILLHDEDESTGFLLVTDYKWNELDVNELYCLAMPKRRDLKTIRDLTAEHLPLLKHMRQSILCKLREEYSVSPDQIRLYFHYHPTYYYLHIHCVHIHTKVGFGFVATKAHLLNDVIENIEIFGSDYYQKKTLSYMLSLKDELYKDLMEHRTKLTTPNGFS